MKVRAFLDAAYALFVCEFQRVGKTVFEAVDMTNESFGIERAPEQVQAAIEAENESSLLQLNTLLAGVR